MDENKLTAERFAEQLVKIIFEFLNGKEEG